MKARELLMEETTGAIWSRLAASIWPLVYALSPGGRCLGVPDVITAQIRDAPVEDGLSVVERDVGVGLPAEQASGRRTVPTTVNLRSRDANCGADPEAETGVDDRLTVVPYASAGGEVGNAEAPVGFPDQHHAVGARPDLCRFGGTTMMGWARTTRVPAATADSVVDGMVESVHDPCPTSRWSTPRSRHARW